MERRRLGEERERVETVERAQHRAEGGVLVAQRIIRLWRIGISLDRGLKRGPVKYVPKLVRERSLLREQERKNEENATEHKYCRFSGLRERPAVRHLARHSSRPAMNRSFGSFLPMNTRIERFLSALVQGLPMSPPIIMCTPWNTTRRGLPFIHSTPL